MLELRITGTRGEILDGIAKDYSIRPDPVAVVAQAREIIGAQNKREIWEEQAVALAALAAQYGASPKPLFLELGACRGYSAAVMKLAAPSALVTTLEPDPTNRLTARANLEPLGVIVRPEQSISYLGLTNGAVRYDLIFVDGDHKHIRADLPWWNRLKVGGLFLHHDYSPLESARPCPPVYEALNEFSAKIGREPDVLVVDDTGVGLWGMYRREGERWEDGA